MDSRKLSVIILALLLALALSASALHPAPESGLGSSAESEALDKPAKALSAPAPDYSGWSLFAFDHCENYYGYCMGSYDIFIGPYGGEYEPFAANSGHDDLGPSLYPGGEKILWEDDSGLFQDLYLANLNGTGTTRLTDNEHRDWMPAFSPDGSKIAFTRSDWGSEIFMINSDGTGEIKLASGCSSPDWSPDGSQIVMTCSQGIFTIRSDGTELAQIASSGYFPIWSPNGLWIAYVDNGDLWRMDAADGGNKTLLYDFPKGNAYPCDWSPDSRMIAFRAVIYDCSPYEPGDCWYDSIALKTYDSVSGSVNTIFGGKKSLINDCSWVSMDQLAPSSAVDPLPATSRSKFTVRWSGIDPGNSGIDWYEVQVRDGEPGEWEPLVGPTSSTSISFKGQVGHTYYFRSRAGDLAGNIEDYPDTPDAWTTVTR